MKGKTQTFYDKNPKSRAKKLAYDKANNAKPANVKKRVELNKINRKAQANGTAKVGDSKDASHTRSGVVMKPQSKNRGSKSDSAGDKRARGKKK